MGIETETQTQGKDNLVPTAFGNEVMGKDWQGRVDAEKDF